MHHNSKIFEMRSKHIMNLLKHDAMNCYQIADYFNVSHSTSLNYIKYFRKNKMIYIAYYRMTEGNRQIAYYLAGNQPDVKKERIKKKSMKQLREESFLINPRLDIHSAWMRNPIC